MRTAHLDVRIMRGSGSKDLGHRKLWRFSAEGEIDLAASLAYHCAMQDNRFNYCPQCASTRVETVAGGRKWVCPECGFVLYNNVAAAVGVIFYNDKGEVLFERRGRDPRKGFLALPGGFCEPDEEALATVRRECSEEIGVTPENLRFVGAFPNIYPYKGAVYKTCDLFYRATLPRGFAFHLEAGEVADLQWHKADTRENVEALPLAFNSARRALLAALASTEAAGESQ